jgi:HD-GYP domain-containing protein (c-di-GMP phosphodiesterase class II)
LTEALGVPTDQLIHIRRGALLHDIGKMAIPDKILHKPGPLTTDEWEVVKKHPMTAFELLLPIPFLHKALDIPYCHHERWDGSGYPRGLKGEEIPLSARIFSVVDVWDALTSDRPYRAAISPENAMTYLKDQSGIYFDPEIVLAFEKVILKQ